MMKCWAKQPDERSLFSEVVTSISNYTEAIAGYLDINFNPFESIHDQLGNESKAATDVINCPDIEENVLISAELLAKQMSSNKTKTKDTSSCKKSKSSRGSTVSPRVTPKSSPKVTPKSTPKPSPRSSPRISPRSSPLLKLRKLKDDQLSASSVGIEIHIESPSEDGSVKSGLLSVK